MILIDGQFFIYLSSLCPFRTKRKLLLLELALSPSKEKNFWNFSYGFASSFLLVKHGYTTFHFINTLRWLVKKKLIKRRKARRSCCWLWNSFQSSLIRGRSFTFRLCLITLKKKSYKIDSKVQRSSLHLKTHRKTCSQYLILRES